MVRTKKITSTAAPTVIKKTFGRTGVFKEGNRYRFYHRGRLIESRTTKGLSFDDAKELIKLNSSFKPGIKREFDNLSNKIEVTTTKKADVDTQGMLKGNATDMPRLKKIVTRGGEDIALFQYVVSGVDDKGNVIAARSQMYGREFAKTSNQMRDEAWKNFYKRLDAFMAGNFKDSDKGDAGDGRLIYINSSNRFRNSVREGFVSYR